VVLAERMIASFLPAGTLTAVNYGQNFIYLCELCGAGSVAYLAALAALRVLPVAQEKRMWPRE